jgi:hypothetical protein
MSNPREGFRMTPARIPTSPLHYATYFDRHYFSRGLAMYQSLVRHSPPFVLWVLCLDDETYCTLARLRLEHVELIELSELERAHPALLQVKPGREAFEYYWTCGPALLLYIFQRHASINALAYLDADLFFFGDPSPLHRELKQNSILLIEHRFSPAMYAVHARKGIYNVGLILFRRTPVALACLEWWRERCIEWCFGWQEPGRFGDQKYLDEWPSRFGEVTVSGHLGAGLAPWNVANYHYRYERGRITVDGVPLIFYHFNRLRVITSWLYDPGLWRYQTKMIPLVKRQIYLPYVRELRAAGDQIRSVDGRVYAVDNLIFGRNRWVSLLRMTRHRSFLIVSDRLVR